MRNVLLALPVCVGLVAGCGAREIQPVDIFPEDMCAHCRMAFSDKRYAAELVTADREIYKFDDIGCWEAFKKQHADRAPAAEFVRDYESNSWLPAGRATIVLAGVATPMASGKVAFADSTKAASFAAEHPFTETEKADSGTSRGGKED